MHPVVELKQVHSASAAPMLRGISFSVDAGEVVALIGKSGSGKSTALRCMDRLETADEGAIHVCGHALHDAAGLDLRAAARRGHRVPELQPVPAHDGAAERDAGAALGQGHQGRGRARTGDGGAGACRPGRQGRTLSRTAVRRPAAARGHRPLAGDAAQGHAVRRSDLGAGPGTDRRGAEGDRPAGRRGHDHDPGHARDGFRAEVADKVIFMHQGQVWEEGAPAMLAAPATPELRQFLGSGLARTRAGRTESAGRARRLPDRARQHRQAHAPHALIAACPDR